jgi:hypothetical protein
MERGCRSPRALGLQGAANWDFQTFTVAGPYVEFSACEYDGVQHTQSAGNQPIYGHFSTYTYNARGVAHWDVVTDETHPCE